MRRTLPVSLALVLMVGTLALVACGPGTGSTTQAVPTAAPPTPAEETITQASRIVGIWQIYDPHCTPGFMIVRPDGTFTWSCHRDGSAGLSGKYRFDGDRLVVLNDLCGAEGQYEVHASGSDPASRTLAFKVIKDDCAAEVNAFTTQKLTWDSALP